MASEPCSITLWRPPRSFATVYEAVSRLEQKIGLLREIAAEHDLTSLEIIPGGFVSDAGTMPLYLCLEPLPDREKQHEIRERLERETKVKLDVGAVLPASQYAAIIELMRLQPVCDHGRDLDHGRGGR